MKLVHVAVAVIRNQSGDVLIARRPDHVHQGGKLEFPGGKVEEGETVQNALTREIQEELGITVDVSSTMPLIKITHHYDDKSVCLDVWEVLSFSGQPHGREGQPIFWMRADSLKEGDFPAANAPIIRAINLPERVMVTPDLDHRPDELTKEIQCRIKKHQPQLVILRLPRVGEQPYRQIAEQLVTSNPGIQWQIHTDIDLAKALGVGLHVPSIMLVDLDVAKLQGISSLSASIHNQQELEIAQQKGIGTVLLGAVKPTSTHPEADGLGWEGFAKLSEQACIPVYALGGLNEGDLAIAKLNGAQGIAGISLFE